MASTPPPQEMIAIPPTPLHGARYDSYQPYAVRKSARFSTHRVTRTPSPGFVSSPRETRFTPQKFNTASHIANNLSPPSSLQGSPRKHRQSPILHKQISSNTFSSENGHSLTNMLPTPIKTPRKKLTQPNSGTTARILFPSKPMTIEEAMPSPRRRMRAKKHITFSLEEENPEERIEVFTDSKDRVPDVDDSMDNPFYVPSKGDLMQATRQTKKRKLSEPERNVDVREAIQNNDGMIYVFRGRKIYRKFEDDEEDPNGEQGHRSSTDELASSTPPRRFTRSSVKPRLLFPNARRLATQGGTTTDEEAVTDIENPEADQSAEDEDPLSTPVKMTFTPASPPSTVRTTRSSRKRVDLDSSPIGPEPVEMPRFSEKRTKKLSPFDEWQRTKPGIMGTAKARKREGESLLRDDDSKRQRNNSTFCSSTAIGHAAETPPRTLFFDIGQSLVLHKPTMDQETKKDRGPGSKRNSYNRVPIARRATRGPLDGDDPLSGGLPQTPQKESPPFAKALPPSPNPFFPSEDLTSPEQAEGSFSFLLRPEIYHPLSQLDIPAPFRDSAKGFSTSTPLDALLSSGHFRLAATAAAAQLSGPTAPSSYSEIFSFFYIRLACLTLIGATALAAQEAKALEDLNSDFYKNSVTGAHLLPWELRVLAVRLQSIGYGDPRRGVTGYYELAKDARAEVLKAKTSGEKDLWTTRLLDLGVRVANVLVQMGDLVDAARHLETLRISSRHPRHDEVVNGRLALLYLKIGDLTTARQYIANEDHTTSSSGYAAVLLPLLEMAEGRYPMSGAELPNLKSATKSIGPLTMQNMAVCLLYSGNIAEARMLLEDLVSEGQSFPALLFNLSTIFELCTDRSRGLKMELAERVASKEGTSKGWERGNADFKL